jgi:dsRNA-specific ribonuclease
MVQEYVQHKNKETPIYVDYDEEIDEKWNVIKYRSDLTIMWQKVAEWFGTNKKKAQEDAAKKYYLMNNKK